MITPIILCGGVGGRLWPLSRRSYPKQFLHLLGDESFFEQTVKRVANPKHYTPPVVICNEEHQHSVVRQLKEIAIEEYHIVIEPVIKNTASAITVASLVAAELYPESLLLALPSDHEILDQPIFHQAVEQGALLAKQGYIVTFGVTPSYPATGYGYIEPGERVRPGYKIASFKEKPDIDAAKALIEKGCYWNSGMFLFAPELLKQELNSYESSILVSAQAALDAARCEERVVYLSKDHLTLAPMKSFDVAVMEHTEHAAVIELNAPWSDVGSWQSFYDISEQDEQGNVVLGDAITAGTTNSLLVSEHGLLAAIGLDNMVVVQAKDATLIAPKERSEEVKFIGSYLNNHCPDEYLHAKEVDYAWGSTEEVERSQNSLIKRLRINKAAVYSAKTVSPTHIVLTHGSARLILAQEEHVLTELGGQHLPPDMEYQLVPKGEGECEILVIEA